MKFFKDKKNLEWRLVVNVAALKAVKSVCGVDLFNIISLKEGEKPDLSRLTALAEDPILLVDVLYTLCAKQIAERNMTPEEFAEGLNGDVLEKAFHSLIMETFDFFPEAKRLTMTKLWTIATRYQEKNQQELLEKVNDPELEAKIISQMK